MNKFFEEFSKDEQKEIHQLNYDFLRMTLFDWKALFDNFNSFLEVQRNELGLKGLEIIYTSKGRIKLCNSTCSINLIYTINQLMKTEVGNPNNIEMLERSKVACKLMKDITENTNFARIEIKNEQTILTFDNDRRSAYDLEEDYITYLLTRIKQYTQEPKLVKSIKKTQFKRLYGNEDYTYIRVLFNFTLKEIKAELEQQFFDYLKDKIDNVRKKIQKDFDGGTSFGVLEEILVKRLDIMFDENNYLVNMDNLF